MSQTINIPKKIAIYHGYPSLVNSSISITAAVNVFKQYQLVVFGQGLEQNSHPDHINTTNIIKNNGMKNTQVFGYIDSNDIIENINSSIDQWKLMGCAGIFCDNFGLDSSNMTRIKQNLLIGYIHSLNLSVMVSCWDPNDVFQSVNGIDSLINSNDWYLAQSYQIVYGNYELANEWIIRSNNMVAGQQSHGTKIACVTTTDGSPFDQAKMDYAYFSTVLYGFNAFGWGELYFSTNSLLPMRTRKIYQGTKFTGPIVSNNGVFERPTNTGVSIDTNIHKTSVVLQN